MRTHVENGRLLALSDRLTGDPPATLVMAGHTAETNAEAVLADIPSADVVLWCTPPHNSLTGERLLRRVFRSGPSIEWGPPLAITDRPEIEWVINVLSCELGDA